jgi:hypothetical protein
VINLFRIVDEHTELVAWMVISFGPTTRFSFFSIRDISAPVPATDVDSPIPFTIELYRTQDWEELSLTYASWLSQIGSDITEKSGMAGLLEKLSSNRFTP